MRVVLFGASGRIGQRVATELLSRGHTVTGVSRSGEFETDHEEFTGVSGDATDADAVTRLIAGHDAVASTLGPSGEEAPDVLSAMLDAILTGMRRANVERLIWTGGAGGLNVGPDTLLVETEEFPEEWRPVAEAAIDVAERLESTDDIEWSYVAPAALIEPGDRTGEYRTAEGELVADEDGESYISMEDFAIAFVDELETGAAVGVRLGVGY